MGNQKSIVEQIRKELRTLAKLPMLSRLGRLGLWLVGAALLGTGVFAKAYLETKAKGMATEPTKPAGPRVAATPNGARSNDEGAAQGGPPSSTTGGVAPVTADGAGTGAGPIKPFPRERPQERTGTSEAKKGQAAEAADARRNAARSSGANPRGEPSQIPPPPRAAIDQDIEAGKVTGDSNVVGKVGATSSTVHQRVHVQEVSGNSNTIGGVDTR